MYPEDVFEEEEETSMMMYSSQIWLRVILNESQNALYGGGKY